MTTPTLAQLEARLRLIKRALWIFLVGYAALMIAMDWYWGAGQ